MKLSASKVLVVDDDDGVRSLMRRVLLAEGYEVFEARDGLEALEIVAQTQPDLVLSDRMMPHMDGLELCRRLKSDPATRLLPVVMLTGMGQESEKLEAIELDADEYLSKPCSMKELRARVRSLLRLKHSLDEMENASAVLQSIAAIVESRDAYTSSHCKEVADLAESLAARLGLDLAAQGRLRLAATFHDIGKIGIEDAVLKKRGPLSPEERKAMERHAALGAELLAPMHTMRGVVPLVRHHHERLDGSGYPDGLKGEQVSLEMRILTTVDIYQALIMERPYKPPFPKEKAFAILREEAAKGWWDPKVVEELASLVGEGARV
jgi:putative two-component system response regulator